MFSLPHRHIDSPRLLALVTWDYLGLPDKLLDARVDGAPLLHRRDNGTSEELRTPEPGMYRFLGFFGVPKSETWGETMGNGVDSWVWVNDVEY
jgi:hypothetical protein